MSDNNRVKERKRERERERGEEREIYININDDYFCQLQYVSGVTFL